MATTTATLTLSSGDLTGDALSLSTTATLTKAGTVTGLDQFTGIARKTFSSTAQVTLIAKGDYTDDRAHKKLNWKPNHNIKDYITDWLGENK